MAAPTGQIRADKSTPYYCVSAEPVSAVSLLIGTIAIMGFSAPPTSGAVTQVDAHLPVFGTSPLRTQTYALAEEPFSVPSALASIRRLTAFRWDELANQFGVSRRAIHDWASGKPLSRKNEQSVKSLLERVREYDTGSPATTRSLIAAAATGQAAQPLFQPESRRAARPNRRARERIASAGGLLLGADQSPEQADAPKLIKRVPITVKKT